MNKVLVKKFLPDYSLREHITSYTLIDIPYDLAKNMDFSVLPSCQTRMILFIGKTSFQVKKDELEAVQPYSLTGLYSRPQLFVPKHALKQIMIQFTPWGVQTLLDFPLAEITDTRADLNFIFKEDLELLCHSLQNIDADKIKDVLDIFLKNKFRKANAVDKRAKNIAQYIFNTNGTLRLNQLSSELFISERTAQRLIHNSIGINYKFFSRLVRLEYVRKLLRNGNLNLTEVALSAGYFDQAHFIHEFQSGFGETPRAYLEKQQKLIWNQLHS